MISSFSEKSYAITLHTLLRKTLFRLSMKSLFSWLLIGVALSACSPRSYSPQRTYQPQQLQKDFQIMRASLEAGHPGLYWYTSKAKLDSAFDATAQNLNRPMTEMEFRRQLDPLVELIHCGHTNVRGSRSFERWRKHHTPKDFPLSVFEMTDRIFVSSNFSNQPELWKGQELVKIDGRPAREVYHTLRSLVISDGYNQTFKNTTILNNFPTYYRYWYGEKETYDVTVLDSLKREKTYQIQWKKEEKPKGAVVASVRPVTGQVRPANVPALAPAKTYGNRHARLSISSRDSSLAILDLNTFSINNYRRLFRRLFRQIERNHIQHLVLDLRNNGGGRVAASNLLMRYVMDQPFQAYQSVESLPYSSTYNRYTNERLARTFMLKVVAKTLPDGRRIIRHATRTQKPIRKYGYHGDMYILTNGGSFSASSITAANLQFWKRAVIIGRETGGGRNGCTAWTIPYLTLPQSHLRIRFPLFKALTAVTDPNEGHGVIPDHPITFTAIDLLANQDPDIEKVYELLRGGRLVKE